MVGSYFRGWRWRPDWRAGAANPAVGMVAATRTSRGGEVTRQIIRIHKALLASLVAFRAVLAMAGGHIPSARLRRERLS
jgi:hypothetical protein